ncbi:MAG TPA: hypothetical protein VK524_13805 [Polyangiaceae bacterium]|nr:hypothetical protein [Polyangiaceae bacterium]
MASGPPPSSRLRPAGDSALDRARGELRDAVGALKNLDQLLRSLRVGPRALSSVIPDVHASCVQMLRAAKDVLAAIAAKLVPNTEATAALEAFMLPRIAELEQGLSVAMNRQMIAKHRLALERIVTELTRDLDCARELIDLLEEATSAPRICVDLSELLQQTFKPFDSEDTERPRAALDLSAQSVEVYVSPRVATALFSIAAEFTSGDGSPLRIALERDAAGRGSVTMARDSASTAERSEARYMIEPMAVCLRAAASVLGAELEHSADGSSLRIIWPNESSTRKRAGAV